MIILKEEIFKGLPASKGIAIGKPFLYMSNTPAIVMNGKGFTSAEQEIYDYKDAIEKSKKELRKIFNLAKDKLDDTNLLIFEAQLQFLDDEILHESVMDRIKKEKKTAGYIFNSEIKKLENKLISSNNEYIRERISDIEDIKNRVLRRLVKEKLFSKIDENSIVIARNLTPGDAILFSSRKLLGFATDVGGTTSHVSIIARSLNVPAVVGLQDLSVNIKPTDYLIIDGYKGDVIINPSQKTLEKYKSQIKKIYNLEQKLIEIEKLSAETSDGRKIKLSVNLEFNKEIDYVVAHANCEIGLYRTEHMFLEQGDFPSLNEQYRQYKMLADRIYPNKVTIRTFDIGGDKLLPDSQKETNPFLGWRGIRICLDKPDIFLDQLKAILKASVRGNLKIMFPMISSLDEVLQCKKLLQTAKSELKRKKIPFDNDIEIGIMVEVPSAVLLADILAKQVNFFSIGTNDLVQYILAVDRDSSIVSNLYQKLHPAVVRTIYSLVQSAVKNKIVISVCGEMAGDPLAALLLIGFGVDELSVETTSYLRIKKLIRQVNFKEAKKIAAKVLRLETEHKIREYLEKSYKKITQEV